MSKEEYLECLYTEHAEMKAKVENLDKEYRNLWQRYRNSDVDQLAELKPKMWAKYHELEKAKGELETIKSEINKTEEELDEAEEKEVVVKERKLSGLAKFGIVALALASGGVGYAIAKNTNCAGKIATVQSDDLKDTKDVSKDLVLVEDKATPVVTPEVVATPVVEATPVVTATPTAEPTVEPTEEPVVEVKPFESYGNFTDASDPAALEERANWYFDTYFSQFSEDELAKSGITRESLIDIMSVFNGKLPVDGNFEVNELLNYNNKAVKAFVNFPSSWSRVKKGERIYIPTQFLFEDGSYEQKCAAEVDDLMEKIIKAMNEEDYVSFYENTVKYGELMRDQYYLVDNTTDHYSVRSIASFPSRIHLYGLAYANWADNIQEFQISRELDVCVDFCFDHETKEMTQIPLANLMATLEYIPMGEWDAVLQRAGITPEQIAKLGNSAVEDPMPVVFTRDAKNHFRELIREKEEQKTLKLG